MRRRYLGFKFIMRKFFHGLAKLPFFVFQRFVDKSPKARSLVFDTSPNDFLIADQDEVFVVSTGDKVIARTIFSHGTFDIEKFYLATRIANLTTGATTLVDVGANIGSICIPLVKRKVVARAVAIEPEPLNFRLLRTNILLNGLEHQIDASNIALGSERDHVVLELSEDNFGDHRVRGSGNTEKYGEGSRRHVEVQMSTLDDVLAKYLDEDLFLWIDTQGFEGHVLAGGRTVLAKAHPIVIEFWPYGMNRVHSFSALKTALSDSAYSCFYDLGKKDPERVSLNALELTSLYERLGEDGDYSDILLLA